MSIYDIDIIKATRWNIRRKYRKPRILALLNAMAYPVSVIYNDLLVYRSAKLYQLMITGQKCWLERLLNDRYDYTQRRIYIDDSVDKSALYIYKHAELKPRWIYRHSENKPVYLYTNGESGENKNDFIVFVPMSLAFDVNEMSSLVKSFKVAGTKFRIQRF